MKKEEIIAFSSNILLGYIEQRGQIVEKYGN
jgi:hypothetical protein